MNVARMLETRNARRILLGKSLGRPTIGWEDNVKMGPRRLDSGNGTWMELA
jgi:hypothetical protein